MGARRPGASAQRRDTLIGMSDSAEFGSASVMAYTLDTSRAPLVIVRATPAVDDEAAIAAWYAGLDAFLAREQRFVSLMDMRGAPSDAARRKRFMAFVSARKERLRRLCVAHAGVVGSTLERGFFTAIA